MKGKNINVKVFIFIAIIAVVILSLISTGMARYLSEVNLMERQIVEKSRISLQAILTLAERSINGANLMNLKNTTAMDLYKTNSDLLYLNMSGQSAGSPKTDFFDAIPPQKIEYLYSLAGIIKQELNKKITKLEYVEVGDYFIDEENWALILNEKLNIKNGGSVQAVFSADSLNGIGWKVFKNVFLVSILVLFGAAVVAMLAGIRVAKPIDSHIGNLQHVISEVSEVSSGIDRDAAEISSAVQEQSSITAQQSTSVSEITSTMEELSATSTQIADNSQSVVDISEKALESAEHGTQAADAIKEKMEEISLDNINNINQIVDLGKKSKEISKVMEIINNIADQTKLIAFNAAIEASSAGEAGKRFGVVAVEIRRLADNVMESTGEIEGKIEEIQDAVNRLVIASEKSSKRVNEGNKLSAQTVDVLLDIVNGTKQTVDSSKQISLSTQQQKTASSQVVSSLKEISEGSKQASATIKQTGAITHNMADLSNNLKVLVEKFNLNGAG